MSQQELLARVVGVLSDVGILYMASGSIVSSLQGEPRSTHDIDLVVSIQKKDLTALSAGFPPPRYYLDVISAAKEIESAGMFNLIDVDSGDKIDFWMLTDSPFDRSRFSRRYAEDLLGLKLQVSSPEDTVLAKLRWAKLSGGSEKQFTDAVRIFEVQFGGLDEDYLDRWARQLGLIDLLDRVKTEASPI